MHCVENNGMISEHDDQALVDVQCLWLMLGGVRVGDSQRSVVSPLPHRLLGWRQGMTGVHSPANY
jgi:hypothetical protein